MKSMLKSLMSVAAAALALTSCSTDATEDVMPNGGSKTLVVNASIDQTRTVMAADHVKLDWAKDDQIHLYIGAEATEAEARSIDPVTGGEITGVTYNANDKVYAYYSLPEDGKYSSGAKNALINIVKEQTQTEANVFAGKNLPMVASSSIENGIANLVFKPVGCVLVFNVYGQGTTAGEKIKSIKFETSKGCYGYDSCDLTADEFKYEAYSKGTDATVTLTNPATIGASKPSDTKVGENQIYLVVAQAEYPAGSKFTVTTDANNAYNFTTTSALDCSKTTARVVNLNLAKAPEMQPAIEVPDVPEQKSEGGDLVIENIVLKNITASDANVGVYSDKELTTELTESWLTVKNTTDLANGKLYCDLAANTDTTPRTAYIGIKYGETVKAAIAVTQVGAGSTPVEKVVATYVPADMKYNNAQEVSDVKLDNGAVTLNFAKGTNNNSTKYYTDGTALRCYGGNTITVSGSKITKIVIARGKSDSGKALNLTSGGGTLSDDIWTGESNEVVLTVDGTSGNIRIKSMEITYVESKEPKIIVPEVGQQPAAGGNLTIENIVFKNFAADQVAKAIAGVYSDADLSKQENVDWLTIVNNATDLSNGAVNCKVAENTTTAERTAYIGIKCGDVQAAIAVTQIGAADPGILFKEDFNTLTGTAEWKGWSSKFSAATKVYEAEGAVRLGTSSSTGSITTQKLNLSAPVTLEFKVKGWTQVEGKIKISVNGTVVGDEITYNAKKADNFEQKIVKLEAATSTSTITIATTAKRAIIDDIVVKVTEQ